MNNQSLQVEDAKLGTPVIYVFKATGYKLKTQIISGEPRMIDGQPHVLVAMIGNWVPIDDLQKQG
jgi:hypothetical protein